MPTATVGLGGVASGTYLGSGAGTVDLAAVIQIQAAGATFDFAPGLFLQWTGSSNSISILGKRTLTNTGSMIISVNNGYLIGNSGINGGGTANQGGTLDNQGTITQPSGYIYLNDSVAIKNEGTYDFTGTASINFGNSSNDSPSITNTSTGLFEQTGAAVTSTVGVLFNNQGGTVTATAGTLSLAGGTSSTNGNFDAQGSGTVGLGGIASGTYLGSGTGTGVVDLTGTIQIQPAGATFDFAAGLFQWTGNSINLDGNTLTNRPAR